LPWLYLKALTRESPPQAMSVFPPATERECRSQICWRGIRQEIL
jgi:hypothetical protein